MPKRRKVDAKTTELGRSRTLNPHPEAIVDPLFQNNPFFDARDLLQARYEMLRRHRIEGRTIMEATLAFGVSRPTFYHAQATFPERVSPVCYRNCAARKGATSFPTRFSSTFSR
jgi:hypothetical protein